MIVVRDLCQKINIKDPVVTIGNFDGIHIGHQKILKTLKDKANAIGGTPTVITFDPHPLKVLAPDREIKMITNLEDKLELLRQNDIGAVVIINFTKEFAGTEADEFISDILYERLAIKAVVVGHGYVFGKAKKGTTELLRRRGKRFGFAVTVVRYKMHGQNVASSSRIRKLLQKGRVSETAELLGRAYHINGTVVRGTGRGTRILSIPTANIHTNNDIIPLDGVYAGKLSFLNQDSKKTYDAVVNIGNNPTFGNDSRTCEAHLMDFSGDLFDSSVRLHFIRRIRDEKRFDTPEKLRQQILIDINVASEVLLRDNTKLFL